MNVYDFIVRDSQGNDVKLDVYHGKMLLIINSATHCGYTKQYPGLETLYQKYHDQGLEILDFPCNQFAGHAPEDIDDYFSVCRLNHGTTFPIFDKIKVNGPQADPLYKYLKSTPVGENKRIRWNFTKFLIDRHGEVIGRYDSKISPEELDAIIAELI